MSGKEERNTAFCIFINYFTYIQKLNISIIIMGEATMKDRKEHSILTSAVRSLKLFRLFWVKFTFRRS